MKSNRIKIFFLFLFLIFGAYQITFAQCTTTLNPGANIASAVSSAANGATICLNNGIYGSINLANISKNNYVTVKSVNSKGASIGYTNIGNSDYIRIEDVVIKGLLINACSSHIRIVNNKFTSGLAVRNDGCSPNSNLDILIDSNTFDNLSPSLFEGRISLGWGGNPSGITLTNNIISGSGPAGNCSDGIFLGANVSGVQIGPGNVFRNLIQGSCAAHVDAIQDYGAGSGNVIKGNYFVNNTVDIGIYDGGRGYTVVDNVFDTPNSTNHQAIQMGGIQGMLMEHNTFLDTTLGIGTKSANRQHSGWVVQNNIFDNSDFTASGDQPGCGSDCTMRYNLKSRGGSTNPTGTNNVTGNAIYVGSGSVDKWPDWRLAIGSPGKNSASDGKDMGTTYYGSGTTSNPTQPTTPSAPENLRVVQ